MRVVRYYLNDGDLVKTLNISIAERIDSLRIIPRLLLVAVYIFAGWYIVDITQFYFLSSMSMEITAFITVTVPAITGIVSLLTKHYFETGRKW